MIKANNLDKTIAVVFLILTATVLFELITSQRFFDWAFDRHHNLWSWYIRPLFLIPFCFFAYKRSIAGISITLFALTTSMFWFDKPEISSEQVKSFLKFEKEWLYGDWDSKKILLSLSVPISLIALGFAFWRRSLFLGLGIIVLMAMGKILWSIYFAGESGKGTILPATSGLVICCLVLFFGFKRFEKKKQK